MQSNVSVPAAHPDEAEILALLERIDASRPFRKSLRQKELLHFIARRAMDSPGAEIHEQEIGTAVFGRPVEYDTSSDNIVRVNTYELRKRLEAYFSSEGREERWTIELPKGGYAATFVPRRRVINETPAAASARRPHWIWIVVALLPLFGCGLLLYQNITLRQANRGAKAVAPLSLLWSRMFAPGRATDIVVADSNLSLLQDLTRRDISPGDYFGSRPVWRTQGADLDERDQRTLDLLMSRRYTSLADVRVLQRLMLLCGKDAAKLDVHYAREYSPENLKASNIILIGSKRANPWVALFEEQISFRFEQNEETGFSVIVDKLPEPGQSGRFATQHRGDAMESYGVVVFLPNLAGTGNVLILAGGGMHATESAGDLVMDSGLFSELLRVLKIETGAPLPYFEALVQTTVIGATMRQPKLVLARKLKTAGH